MNDESQNKQDLKDLRSLRNNQQNAPKKANMPKPVAISTKHRSNAPLNVPTVAANDSDEDPINQLENETVEQTEVLKAIDQKIAVQTENSITSTTNQQELIGAIDRLNGLTTRLHQKYEAANDSVDKLKPEQTTLESITDVGGDAPPTQQQENSEAGEKLFPKRPKPSNGLVEGDGQKSGKELESTKDAPMKMGFKSVVDVLKSGFKSAQSSADKISMFLFKMSITQVARAAVIASMLFSIIAAIDVIRIYWAIWGEKVLAKINEWLGVLNGWWESFKTFMGDFAAKFEVFESIGANLMEIKNAWVSGDFPALAKSIGGALLDLGKTITAMFTKAVTSILGTILRKFGMDDTADTVESIGLRRYQNLTDGKLSKEEQLKLAESQVKNEEKDGKTTTERGMTDFLPASWRKKLGLISNSEYDQIQKEKKDLDSRKNLSHDDKVKNTAATNEAREAIARYKKFAEAANPNNPKDMEKVNKYKQEAQSYLSNKALDLTPTTKAELVKQYNTISSSKQAKVTPVSAKESNETQLVQSIKNNEAKNKAKDNVATTTANVQNNVVRNNKNVYVQQPVTSTNAPGIHGAIGVN